MLSPTQTPENKSNPPASEVAEVIWNIGDYSVVSGLDGHVHPETTISLGQSLLGLNLTWRLQYGDEVLHLSLLEVPATLPKFRFSFTFVIKCTMAGTTYIAQGNQPVTAIDKDSSQSYEVPAEFECSKGGRMSLGIPTGLTLKGEFALYKDALWVNPLLKVG